MRILIAAVGRMKQGPERELMARYLERATATGRAMGLAGFEVVEAAESRAATADRR
jgi:23S rRNA (pseudouridine1915-N3)-methyltransferase